MADLSLGLPIPIRTLIKLLSERCSMIEFIPLCPPELPPTLIIKLARMDKNNDYFISTDFKEVLNGFNGLPAIVHKCLRLA